MARYAIRRLIQSFFLILGVTIITFFIQRVAPGGPAMFFEDPKMKPADIRAIEESFGLHEPWHIQYGKWVWGVARFDFGRSFIDGRPAVEKIAERMPATFQLSLASFLLGLLGIPLGIYAAMRRGSWADNVIRVLTVAGNAVPHWWLGLMILIISASTIKIFPLGGMYTLGADSLPDRLWHLALPATIGAMGGWITFARFMRSEILEVISQDYIRTAFAKGLTRQTVLTRHALRNALIPVVTILGGSLSGFFSGAVLFEQTFSWPGMGRLAIQAAFQRDYPVLMAETVIFALLIILGNLIADLAYGLVDPRVKIE
ncbi:MAG: ABC transporter permease [Chloroflexi bacterium]|nr:ABC transporter permease [Chloroflexota bacterium]